MANVESVQSSSSKEFTIVIDESSSSSSTSDVQIMDSQIDMCKENDKPQIIAEVKAYLKNVIATVPQILRNPDDEVKEDHKSCLKSDKQHKMIQSLCELLPKTNQSNMSPCTRLCPLPPTSRTIWKCLRCRLLWHEHCLLNKHKEFKYKPISSCIELCPKCLRNLSKPSSSTTTSSMNTNPSTTTTTVAAPPPPAAAVATVAVVPAPVPVAVTPSYVYQPASAATVAVVSSRILRFEMVLRGNALLVTPSNKIGERPILTLTLVKHQQLLELINHPYYRMVLSPGDTTYILSPKEARFVAAEITPIRVNFRVVAHPRDATHVILSVPLVPSSDNSFHLPIGNSNANVNVRFSSLMHDELQNIQRHVNKRTTTTTTAESQQTTAAAVNEEPPHPPANINNSLMINPPPQKIARKEHHPPPSQQPPPPATTAVPQKRQLARRTGPLPSVAAAAAAAAANNLLKHPIQQVAKKPPANVFNSKIKQIPSLFPSHSFCISALDGILRHLDINDRLQCRLVCANWKRIIDSSNAWQTLSLDTSRFKIGTIVKKNHAEKLFCRCRYLNLKWECFPNAMGLSEEEIIGILTFTTNTLKHFSIKFTWSEAENVDCIADILHEVKIDPEKLFGKVPQLEWLRISADDDVVVSFTSIESIANVKSNLQKLILDVPHQLLSWLSFNQEQFPSLKELVLNNFGQVEESIVNDFQLTHVSTLTISCDEKSMKCQDFSWLKKFTNLVTCNLTAVRCSTHLIEFLRQLRLASGLQTLNIETIVTKDLIHMNELISNEWPTDLQQLKWKCRVVSGDGGEQKQVNKKPTSSSSSNEKQNLSSSLCTDERFLTYISNKHMSRSDALIIVTVLDETH